MKRYLAAALMLLTVTSAALFASAPLTKQTTPANLTKSELLRDLPTLPVSETQPQTTRGRTLDEGVPIYVEDFESIVSGDLPPGWRRIDLDGGFCSQWNRSSVFQVFDYGRENAHQGSRTALVHYNDGGVGNNDWLIMPPFVAAGEMHMHYWSASQDPAFLESYEVRLSTTGIDPADFSTVLESVDGASPLWTRHTIALEQWANQTVFVAFHCTSVDKYVLKIDDIEVDASEHGTSGSVTGLIHRALNDTISRPHENALVVLEPIGIQQLSLDDGSFSFDYLPPGTYSLTISATGYRTVALNDINVIPGQTTQVPLTILRSQASTSNLYETAAGTYAVLDHETTTVAIEVDDNVIVSDLNLLMSIRHTWVGDLSLWLRAPNGQTVELVRANISLSGDNLIGTTFNDEADSYYLFAEAPYTGSFRPLNPLSAFDNLAAEGVWSLLVLDNYEQDIGAVFYAAMTIVSIPEGDILDVPRTGDPAPEFEFRDAYPNPFNATTRFAFSLNREDFVSLRIFDTTGREVASLLNEVLPAGAHDFSYSASGLASGVYFARLSVSGNTATQKILLLK